MEKRKTDIATEKGRERARALERSDIPEPKVLATRDTVKRVFEEGRRAINRARYMRR